MSDSTLVTVLMPVHNAMPYLPDAIHSLFAQTLKGVRLLVLDDGSTDGSGEYLESLQYPGLTLIRGGNRGVGAVRSQGLELCRTEFLALMDADDISSPDRLASQLAHLRANPKCVMVGTQIDFIINGKVQKGLPAATSHDEIEGRLLTGGGVVYPTIFFRTSVARSVGGFRLAGAGEEYDFCVRMSEQGLLANVPRPLYQYRLHRSSISMTKQSDLLCGAAYARRTALERRGGLPETSFEEFSRLWQRRGLAETVPEKVRLLSNMNYRRGRISMAEGHRLAGAFHMAIAAVLDPVVAGRHVKRIVAAGVAGRKQSASAQTN